VSLRIALLLVILLPLLGSSTPDEADKIVKLQAELDQLAKQTAANRKASDDLVQSITETKQVLLADKETLGTLAATEQSLDSLYNNVKKLRDKPAPKFKLPSIIAAKSFRLIDFSNNLHSSWSFIDYVGPRLSFFDINNKHTTFMIEQSVTSSTIQLSKIHPKLAEQTALVIAGVKGAGGGVISNSQNMLIGVTNHPTITFRDKNKKVRSSLKLTEKEAASYELYSADDEEPIWRVPKR